MRNSRDYQEDAWSQPPRRDNRQESAWPRDRSRSPGHRSTSGDAGWGKSAYQQQPYSARGEGRSNFDSRAPYVDRRGDAPRNGYSAGRPNNRNEGFRPRTERFESQPPAVGGSSGWANDTWTTSTTWDASASWDSAPGEIKEPAPTDRIWVSPDLPQPSSKPSSVGDSADTSPIWQSAAQRRAQKEQTTSRGYERESGSFGRGASSIASDTKSNEGRVMTLESTNSTYKRDSTTNAQSSYGSMSGYEPDQQSGNTRERNDRYRSNPRDDYTTVNRSGGGSGGFEQGFVHPDRAALIRVPPSGGSSAGSSYGRDDHGSTRPSFGRNYNAHSDRGGLRDRGRDLTDVDRHDNRSRSRVSEQDRFRDRDHRDNRDRPARDFSSGYTSGSARKYNNNYNSNSNYNHKYNYNDNRNHNHNYNNNSNYHSNSSNNNNSNNNWNQGGWRTSKQDAEVWGPAPSSWDDKEAASTTTTSSWDKPSGASNWEAKSTAAPSWESNAPAATASFWDNKAAPASSSWGDKAAVASSSWGDSKAPAASSSWNNGATAASSSWDSKAPSIPKSASSAPQSSSWGNTRSSWEAKASTPALVPSATENSSWGDTKSSWDTKAPNRSSASGWSLEQPASWDDPPVTKSDESRNNTTKSDTVLFSKPTENAEGTNSYRTQSYNHKEQTSGYTEDQMQSKSSYQEASAGFDSTSHAETARSPNAKEQDNSVPYPWKQVTSSSGKIYYFNEETGKSQWENPGAGRSLSRRVEGDDQASKRRRRDDDRSR